MKLLKTKDGLHTIYSDKYNQTYHSKHGVYQEADHVFLKGAGVSEKMLPGNEISILETGFGSGFNFFLTTQLAYERNAVLHYDAIENNLLSYKDFRRLNHNIFFARNPVLPRFLEWRKQTTIMLPSVYEFTYDDIRLELNCCDARDITLPAEQFDAVYHDAFSPLANPELWTVPFFEKMIHAMKKDARLSTYSAKGSVKRAMAAAGFKVEKHKGPMGKREMLVAIKP